ncbi:MAG: DUF2459 domain-containing protein [Rhodospirillaceae bacterium]
MTAALTACRTACRPACPPPARRSRLTGGTLAALACVVAVAACAPSGIAPPPPDALTETVRVFRGGWHTGILLSRADVPAERFPEIADFPEAGVIEFSWGDRAYYRDRDPGLGKTLSAAMAPTPAVMHVAGFSAGPGDAPPWPDTIEIPLSGAELAGLVAAVSASFDRSDSGPEAGRQDEGRAVHLEPGLYGRSFFYSATGRFHLFNTCNTWVARMFEAAGTGMDPGGVITAGGLMDRLRDLRAARRPAPGSASGDMSGGG